MTGKGPENGTENRETRMRVEEIRGLTESLARMSGKKTRNRRPGVPRGPEHRKAPLSSVVRGLLQTFTLLHLLL